MIRIVVFVYVILAALYSPAQAEWRQASSDHFVIYADDDEKDIRSFAERLERFHSAMVSQIASKSGNLSPSNRVTVYVVRNEKEVRKLFGEGADRYLGGFYQPRAGGSFAIIPKLQNAGIEVSPSERVLFHEYAHHFLHGSSELDYPRWLSEGFAEFYSSAKFEKDGSVGLGLPAYHRGEELVYASNVPVTLLLDTKAYLAKKGTAYDEFYGKSWLLFHYLTLSGDRNGQLADYLKLLREKRSEVEAAGAFGDLKQLEKDLNRYMAKSRIRYIAIAASRLQTGTIQVKTLETGHAAMMPVIIRSKRGVNEDQAKELVIEARKYAAPYPKSAPVLAALAEAEFDSGNDQAAISAAEGALAIDATNINALLQKGYAMARLADIGDEGSPSWAKVRQQFIKVNAVENDHPVPLIQFYLTYKRQGIKPTKNAVDGLAWALELAPYDEGLRITLAEQQMDQKQYEAARRTLLPLANSPHESRLQKAASAMMQEAERNIAEFAAKKDDGKTSDTPSPKS